MYPIIFQLPLQNKHLTLFADSLNGYSIPNTFTLMRANTPHPLCVLAAKELQHYLQNQQDWKHNFGLAVDEESSLEMKRLLYMTDRRIRYAGSPALKNAAVYFKSGSLYKCRPEEGYVCAKYKGNVDNFMNSVAIIEHPDGITYMVALMSNVRKKNSASDHMALAASIDRIVRGY